MQTDKEVFVLTKAVELLKNLQADAMGSWGVMNGQQVLEHLVKTIDISNNKIKMELVTPIEYLPKFKEFLYSDKEFRENTKAPINIVSEAPEPCMYGTMEEVYTKLDDAMEGFIQYFAVNPDSKTLHPVFGELNYKEWILIHYKHFTHHLKQFRLI